MSSPCRWKVLIKQRAHLHHKREFCHILICVSDASYIGISKRQLFDINRLMLNASTDNWRSNILDAKNTSKPRPWVT